MFFNIGSQYNGVVIGSNGKVVLDDNGNPTYQPTTGTVTASGLISGTLMGDSIYMVTLHDDNGTPVVSNLTRIASGCATRRAWRSTPRPATSTSPTTGSTAMTAATRRGAPTSWTESRRRRSASRSRIFGFPEVVNGQLTDSYVKTIDKPGDPVTVVNPGVGVQPLVAFEPLPDPVLTVEGSESEGSSGFALSPPSSRPGSIMASSSGSMASSTRAGPPTTRIRWSSPTRAPAITSTSSRTTSLNIGHLDEILSTSELALPRRHRVRRQHGKWSRPGGDLSDQGDHESQSSITRPFWRRSRTRRSMKGPSSRVQASATDPDPNQTITYSLGPGAPAGASIDAQSGLFTWTPDPYSSTGTYSITVVATDNGSPPLSDSSAFTVNVLSVNHPPNLLEHSRAGRRAGSAAPGQGPRLRLRPRPAGADAFLQPGSGAPSGASIDATGLFTWTPPSNQPINAYTIGVMVTDNGSPPLSASETFTVNVVPFNHPPVLSTIPTQTVDEGSLLTVDVTATDSDVPAQTISYSLGAGTPAGAAIDSQSRGLHLDARPYSGSGTYSITIIATDNGSVPKSDSTTFTINVLAVNHPPVIVGDSHADRRARSRRSSSSSRASPPILIRPAQTLSLQPRPRVHPRVRASTRSRAFSPGRSASQAAYRDLIRSAWL